MRPREFVWRSGRSSVPFSELGCILAGRFAIPSSIEDSYLGQWDSFGDYLSEEIELMQDRWPEEAIRYFDNDAYERDARYDYAVLDALAGGVFVFRSC